MIFFVQFYCKTKKSGNKYGNYDRSVVFLIEDNLKQFQKILQLLIEIIYTTNLEVLAYDT